MRGRVTSFLTAVAKTGLQDGLYRSYSNNKCNNKVLFCFSVIKHLEAPYLSRVKGTAIYVC